MLDCFADHVAAPVIFPPRLGDKSGPRWRAPNVSPGVMNDAPVPTGPLHVLVDAIEFNRRTDKPLFWARGGLRERSVATDDDEGDAVIYVSQGKVERFGGHGDSTCGQLPLLFLFTCLAPL
ncbi:hypothetical protein DPEC_G00198250 [Dallia pectoralis]|uniref:Uncharacterized protein n=1 Tax=Dallia pectoralis TaxID=75939 RepID=A0ACC2G850_DALPE|nr:hypothetical protein DPEC_G00198250 [Dallia pectoralis]